MSNKIDKYLLVEIGFKAKSTPYAVTTYYFSDRYAPAGALYSGSPEYYPLLVSVSGLGSELGEVMPKNKTGSIVLNNIKGTIRYDLSVGDLLASHSIVERSVRVRTFEKQINTIGVVGDLVTEFNGFCSNVSIDHRNDTISIDTYENYGGTDLLNAVVTDATYNNTLDEAVAKPVNFIFGSNVEAVAMLVASGETGHSFAYGSTIGDDYINGGITKFLAKDKAANVYGQVSTTPGGASPVVDGVGTAGGTTATMYEDVLEGVEYAYKVNVSGGAIVTGGRFYVLSTDDFNPTGSEFEGNEFNFAMYAKTRASNRPDQKVKLASANAVAADFVLNYDGQFGPGIPYIRKIWAVDFTFDNAVVCRSLKDYFFSWASENGPDATRYLTPILNTMETRPLWVIPGETAPGADRFFRQYSASDIVHWVLWGAEIEDLTADSGSLNIDTTTNRGINRFRVIASASRNQNIECLDELEFIVVCDGIKDDSSGTITGTPGNLFNTVSDVSKFLNSLMNSRTFVTNQYDFNNIVSSSAVSGSFDSLTTVKDAISEILFNGSAKLVPLRSGNLAYYRYGAKKQSFTFISEEDAKLLGLQIGDKASIINAGHLFFNLSRQPLRIEDLQSNVKNYKQSLTIVSTGSSVFADSYNLYGRRYLDDKGTFLNFLSTEDQARYFLDCLFRQWSMETWTMQLLVPYWAEDYKSIEINGIIRFRHQKNLHAFGTDSSVTATPPVVGDAFNFGQVWVRAKTYAARITARAVEYNEGGEPYLKLTAKVLNSKKEIY